MRCLVITTDTKLMVVVSSLLLTSRSRYILTLVLVVYHMMIGTNE